MKENDFYIPYKNLWQKEYNTDLLSHVYVRKIYFSVMKSMTILIIFIFFKFSTLSAPNNIYRAFLVNLHIFLTMQGTCNPAVSNIPTEKQFI